MNLTRALPVFLALTLAACTNPGKDLGPFQEKVRNLLQFETCEFVYRDLVYRGIHDSVLGITTRDTRTLFQINIRVTAGIDANKGIELQEIGADPSKGEKAPALLIKIPPAEILKVDADEDSIKSYFLQEFGFLKDGRVSLLEFSDQVNKTKASDTEDAVRRGILTRAQDTARSVIEKLFHMAGFGTIKFETLTSASKPAASQPETSTAAGEQK